MDHNLGHKLNLEKFVCMHAKSVQLCLTLYDTMDYNWSDSFVRGILQAGIGVSEGQILLQKTFPTQGSNALLLTKNSIRDSF